MGLLHESQVFRSEHELYVLDQIPTLPRTYTQCFRDAQKDFREAGKEWIRDRVAFFPFLGASFAENSITEAAIKNIDHFDARILTPHFYKLAPHLAKTAGIVFWSEGIEKYQKAKIAAVIGQFPQKENGPQISQSVSSDKFDSIGEIYRMSEQLSGGKKENTPPIVLIEDKFTNMIDLIGKTYHHPTREPKVTEENLDDPNFEFAKYKEWLADFLSKRSDNFSRYKFIYVPPDKPADGGNTISMSPLRQQRIKELMEMCNTSLNPSQNASENRFFHIDDLDKDGAPTTESILTSSTLVVADVDGPLVSQRAVLRTREEMLEDIFFETIKPAYEDLFQLKMDDIVRFILANQNNEDGRPDVCILPENSVYPVITKQYLAEIDPGMKIKVLISKHLPEPGVKEEYKKFQRLRIARYDLKKEFAYYFMPDQFRQALLSIGYPLPADLMLQ